MAIGSPQWMYSSGAEAYEIDQSLKFEDGRSTYLSKTFASAGNRRTWTWSAWVKRSNSSATHMLFFTAVAGDLTEDDHFGIRLDSGASSNIVLTWGDGNTAVTNAIFRDPSAWMHIVVAIDTTQGTDTNRVKVYVNGTQQTFSSTDLPSQNFEYGINKAQEHNIGSRVVYGSSGNYYDGYLAEVNFIDGQALTPADFGETGTYGEWKPIEYSGTYGTNGFYLPFKQDYTVEGFSTVTYKGNGGTHYIGGTGFQPDFTWIKKRNGADNHALYNSLMPTYNYLRSDTNQDERTNGALSAKTDGFLLGNGDGSWNASNTYVAWNWDMGADTPTGFGCVIYKGNGSTQSISGYGFSPDVVWIKSRETGTDPHQLYDTVRGATKSLKTDATDGEITRSTGLTAFEPDGFKVGSHAYNNRNTSEYVAWGWDMGGTSVANTTGDINTTVRANTTYGQSIVSWDGTGSGSSPTVGHGLSSAPELIIVKRRSSDNGAWPVLHAFDTTKYLQFQDVDAATTGATVFDNTAPTSTVFTVNATNAVVNASGHTYIAYCFHSVSGYSKIGSFSGSGASGHTITTGFRPAFLIVKQTNAAGENWYMFDSTREPLGELDTALKVDESVAEVTSSTKKVEFTDTGFKLNSTNSALNASGSTYIYYAVAGGMDSISDYNTDGSIDSRVKANTTYGQSIVSYTGNATSGATVGHGLSSAPEMIILKNRNSVTDWDVFHASRGATKFLRLNSNVAEGTNSAIWNDTAPTNSVFSLGNNADPNSNNEDYIAYLWHSVTGYSKISSYIGNGGSNAITTGFEPAFLVIKRADGGTGGWMMYDNVRGVSQQLQANYDAAEDTVAGKISFQSTGFTCLIDHSETNSNGSNYIYMAFADKREYAYWLDQSGNNNDWTSNNLTESDVMVDSPTNNFATFSPLMLAVNMGTELSEGNLKNYEGSTHSGYPHNSFSTMSVTSGKWYFEVRNTLAYGAIGICNLSDSSVNQLTNSTASPVTNMPSDAEGWAFKNGNGNKEHNNSNVSYGSAITSNDVVMCAFDVDAGKIWWGVNGTWIASGNPATAANPAYTGEDFGNACPVVTTENGSTAIINFGQDSSFASNKTAQGNQDGNSIGDFYYTPPTGFLALCTKNLPDVAVVPSEHFNTVLWTGNSTARTISGVGFQPDFSWIRNREIVTFHLLFDAIRGAGNALRSNSTNAESTGATDELTAFAADGLTLGTGEDVNGNAEGIVAWNWKANGSGSSNTNGTIASTVSANVDAGFSIVSWTGNEGSDDTIGHGLSKAPEMIIAKVRGEAWSWGVFHEDIGKNKKLLLNSTDAEATDTDIWADTLPTSNVFTVGTDILTNWDGRNYIGYCFHSVDGYSKVGSYTGNGNADGTFVYTGFKPMMLISKYVGTEDWNIIDTKRSPHNLMEDLLKPNSSAAEIDTQIDIDFLSNGFKPRINSGFLNGNGHTIIYIAFAETPFKYSNAR